MDRGAKDGPQSNQKIEQQIVDYFLPKVIQITKTKLVSEQKQPESVRDQAFIKQSLDELEAVLVKTPDPTVARQMLLQSLRADEIPSRDENSFLLTIPSQLSQVGAKHIFEKIIQNIHEKQLFAIFAGYDSLNWQDVTANDVQKFLATPRRRDPDYRTPVGFSDLRRRFFAEIQPLSSPTQFDEYLHAMNSLEHHLYGARFDYYRIFEAMRKESQAIGQDFNVHLVAETSPDVILVDDAIATPTAVAIENNSETVPLTPINSEECAEIITHATIDGDPWLQNGQEYSLTIETLNQSGLNPIFSLAIDKQIIHLSSLFNLTSEQMAAIAYIPTPTGIKVRGFYREKNTALWHYLPDYIRNISGEGIDVFGTGFDEHSTILPVFLQSALSQIERRHGVVDLSKTNPDFLFAGTAHAYASRQEFHDAFSRGLVRGDFYREVSPRAYNADSNAIILAGRRKVAPQLLSVSDTNAPNLHNLIVRYSTYSGYAGQVMGEGFPANDGSTNWLFFSDYRGRCWVPYIEMISPITTTGCRREWLLPTDITTPLYELTRLADGFGDSNDTRAGNHISMWNNYLSHVPLLDEYRNLVALQQKS